HGTLPDRANQEELALAADERRARRRARRHAGDGFADHPRAEWLLLPLRLDCGRIVHVEQVPDQTMRRGVDDQLVGRRRGLEPRSGVYGVAARERLAGWRVERDDRLARGDGGAHVKI